MVAVRLAGLLSRMLIYQQRPFVLPPPSFVFHARLCHLFSEFIKDSAQMASSSFWKHFISFQLCESGLLPPSGQMTTLTTAGITRNSYFALMNAGILFFYCDTCLPPLLLLELLCCWFLQSYRHLNLGCKTRAVEFHSSLADHLTAIIIYCRICFINTASAVKFALCLSRAVC